MGYALALSACCSCHRVFGYNPIRVPSVRVNGVREPVCRECIERANPLRKQAAFLNSPSTPMPTNP